MDALADVADLAFRRHADELAATWQARALRAALYFDRRFAHPRGLIGMVMLSVIAHSYSDPRADALRTILLVVYPSYESIAAPFLTSAGKIAKTGHVMADMITRDGRHLTNQHMFAGTKQMERDFRRFADSIRPVLTDAEREEMFAAVRRWVVCDYRIDPTMDPRDPDAKRLTVH